MTLKCAQYTVDTLQLAFMLFPLSIRLTVILHLFIIVNTNVVSGEAVRLKVHSVEEKFRYPKLFLNIFAEFGRASEVGFG